MAKGDGNPQRELELLERALQAGAPARGYFLKGEERWFVERAVTAVEEACGRAGLELVRHDGEGDDFSAQRFFDDLCAAPMFAAARAVVLRRADTALAGGKDAPLVRAIVARLAQAQPGCVIVEARALRVDHPVAKAVLAAGGTVLSCRKLYETPFMTSDPAAGEVVKWILARARERGVKLDTARAVLLLQVTGNDLHALADRLEELRADPQAFRGFLRARGGGASPFDLASWLAAGDLERAVPALEDLFADGFRGKDGRRTVDVGGIFAVLAGNLRRKLGDTFAVASGIATPGGNPREQTELRERLALREAEDWRAMIADFAAIERRSRSGADVDVNDLVAFALRWRVRGRRAAVAGGRS